MSQATPLRIAVIVGSTRPGRVGRAVADWFVTQTAGRSDLSIDLVDLVDVPLPARLPDFSQPIPAEVEAFGARLANADGMVVVTPEYNHSFPASLKNAIDLTGEEWHAKPVAFVSYGGLSGGMRSVEALRLVFAEMHAVGIRDMVSLHSVHADLDAEGRLPAAEPRDAAAKTLLDQLAWWADALRTARATNPYSA